MKAITDRRTMMQTEDGQIIYQCLNGDSAMFGFLVEKYKQGVYALAYSKLGNFHDAQDITQETFIKAFQKIRTLKRYDAFALWLSAIANNLCKNFIRSKSKRPDREFAEDQSPDTVERSSMDSYRDNLIHESLQEALNSLPEVYRQVLMLHYFSGYKNMDIAQLLGVSLRTVAERLHAGKERLREEMITMMSETFKEHKLPVGFTFRIVEIIKRIKIHPVAQSKGLPWGLSLATGIIIAVLSLNPYIPQLDQFGTISGAPLLSESKVLKVGEIPVDVVKVSNVPILSNKMGKGKNGEPKQPDIQNALFMAPKAEGNTWAKKTDMPTARDALYTCVVNGKIYAIGGRTVDEQGNDVVIKTVEEYDPVKDNWTKKADMPTARCFLSTSVVDGKIYAIGGFSKYVWNALSTVEVYDPVADTWMKCLDMPTRRGVLSTSVVNGKIYAIGGADIEGQPSLSTVEEYDPVKNAWMKKSDMPTARGGLTTSVVNDEIYAMGGYPEHVPNGNALSTVEVYNPAKDTWMNKADMPTERNGHSTSVVNGKIYVIGGMSDRNASIYKVVEVYDPATDTWAKETDMPTASSWLSTSVVDGKIYAIGGWTAQNLLSTVEEYTPEGWSFAVSPQGKLPTNWGQMKQNK